MQMFCAKLEAENLHFPLAMMNVSQPASPHFETAGSFPDFTDRGYTVVRELGQNRMCGRVTYLATDTKLQLVVIKQFQFAQSGSHWSDYDTYEQEVRLLQQLDHPSIPRYLDSFETTSGFCLVQEYKSAPTVTQSQHWTLEDVKQVATAVLRVLVYLQQQVPLIIHRDIKPENILVDRQGEKVYLVDFGFARLGGGEVAVSSVVKGTLGFMPPEQLFNRQLTEASDLYSLGATLICLLTQTKSTELGRLVDETYRFNFKSLVPKLNPQFVKWLEKMTAPNLKHRYPNAVVALSALESLDVTDKPTVLSTLIHDLELKPRIAALGATVLLAVVCVKTPFISSNNGYPLLKQEPKATVTQLLLTRSCVTCSLSHADLAGTDLRGIDLTDAKLPGANFERSNLENSVLKNAMLWSAGFDSANLRGSNLEGANLKDAQLVSANLVSTNLANASLVNTILVNADLMGADLVGADLTDANLRGANLTNADLTNATLVNTKLEEANLSGATMPDGTVHP